jgi:hypothetical protein
MSSPWFDNELTKVVYIGLSGKCWHLSGPGAGSEGVAWGDGQTGHLFAPVSLLLSEEARGDGATFLRDLKSKKESDFIVDIGGDTLPLIFESMRHFHAVHDSWFRDWSTRRAGTIAYFTRHQGWRYQQVRLDREPVPITGIDPAINYHERYQMGVVALDPMMSHFGEWSVWKNSKGLGEGIVWGRNAADQPAPPRYTMNGPGRFHILDPGFANDVTRIVQTPPILEGETLRIDTHQRHRTARVYSPGNPSGRNVWGQLAGRKWFGELDPWASVPITVMVTGGTTESQVRIDVSPRSSRPY